MDGHIPGGRGDDDGISYECKWQQFLFFLVLFCDYQYVRRARSFPGTFFGASILPRGRGASRQKRRGERNNTPVWCGLVCCAVCCDVLLCCVLCAVCCVLCALCTVCCVLHANTCMTLLLPSSFFLSGGGDGESTFAFHTTPWCYVGGLGP